MISANLGIAFRKLRQVVVIGSSRLPIALLDRDPDQGRDERLGDRERRHHRVAPPAVDVALEDDLVVLDDDERLRLGLGQERLEVVDADRR